MTNETLVKLQPMTRGHFKLLRMMGLKLAEDRPTSEGVDDRAVTLVAGLTAEERQEEGLAWLWLMTRPLDQVKPGGSVHLAIKAGEWRDLVDAWEFELDEVAMTAIPELLAKEVARDDE